MEAVALFSFTASEADEISFQRGDTVKVSVEALGVLPLEGLEVCGRSKKIMCMFVYR